MSLYVGRELPGIRQLLFAAGAAGRRQTIEIHRASWRKVQGRNEGVSPVRWMADFGPWSERLARAGLTATVFLWEKIHHAISSPIFSASMCHTGSTSPPTRPKPRHGLVSALGNAIASRGSSTPRAAVTASSTSSTLAHKPSKQSTNTITSLQRAAPGPGVWAFRMSGGTA